MHLLSSIIFRDTDTAPALTMTSTHHAHPNPAKDHLANLERARLESQVRAHPESQARVRLESQARVLLQNPAKAALRTVTLNTTTAKTMATPDPVTLSMATVKTTMTDQGPMISKEDQMMRT